ncbi:Rne/Rng family ribonuclease [Yimella sp. NH-Cas1]|uniref:Rne/Rng family ribonuclease n=1 Tax=Yimella sp. NH-Cas1 TaxID=2917726 RepID=UPI001EFA9A28|nr:Rne/Rng family ribonuclease [Yimella sp. NH-Cas1]MCG8654929.1 Rne/Rng family ribonuclease [Yimella sp. NH-Cas1]
MGPQQNEPGSLFSAQSDGDATAKSTDQERPSVPAVPPSFGLIFQTPDLEVRVPRRRAQDDADDNEDAGGNDAPVGRSNSDSDETDDSIDGGGRGRRRGGRGRRTRGQNDDNHADGQNESRDQGRDRSQDDQESDADSEQKSEDKPNQRSGRGRNNRNKRSDRGGDGGQGPDDNNHDSDDTDDSGDGADDTSDDGGQDNSDDNSDDANSRRRTRRRRRSGTSADGDDPPGTVTKVREPRKERDEVTAIKGSTRLEAKKQRRREGREAGRRRTSITEAEFLARRESVERVMVVRERDGRTQIGVLEDGVLVEHYVSRETQQSSMAGNVYLGRVQNVLPSMEAAFVDIGRGRNAVLYAGEVNWDAAGLDNQPKRIEHALSSGESVLVQVTKDPIGHKGARLTSQVSLPGRFLVYVPGNSMTGISRKLPDNERARLKKILKEVVPADAGVIVRTAAEGASEEDLRADVERLQATWEQIQKASKSQNAPSLLHGEPDLTLRVIRDVFNEDFSKLIVAGDTSWDEVSDYIGTVAPDLAERLEKWTGETDLFTVHRVDEQLTKALDRKVWLPSGGSLVIDRTEAMTVVDVNTGKFIGSGGNLEETVTRNNLEAAEEIVRQLRLRDIGGIIVVDFIDMVLESNRDLVVRRLLECLGRDRTKHQVAEVTSLGLVQMTRKRVGSGLLEIFSENCVHCDGRGVIVHDAPVEKSGGNNAGNGNNGNSGSGNNSGGNNGNGGGGNSRRSKRGRKEDEPEQQPKSSGPTAAQIAAAAHAAAAKKAEAAQAAGDDAHVELDLDVDAPTSQVEMSERGVDERPVADVTASVVGASAAPVLQAPATTEPPARKRRGSRRAGSPSVAPASAPEPQEVPQTVVAAEAPDAGSREIVADEPEQAPAAPVKRRPRRARVVSPAGPPANHVDSRQDARVE